MALNDVLVAFCGIFAFLFVYYVVGYFITGDFAYGVKASFVGMVSLLYLMVAVKTR